MPHCWPAAQTLPQPPQLRGSVSTSTQASPHLLVSPPQAQLPFRQEAPLPQALPQLPQLAGSVRRSAQPPTWQKVVPGEHRQAPDTHSSSGLQGRPQLPQLS